MGRHKPIRIGFSYFERPFLWGMVSHALRDEANRWGIEVVQRGSPDVAHQIKTVESFIDESVDAVLISPIVSKIALLPLLALAKQRRIAVALIGSEISGAEDMPLVRSDSYTGQAQVAEAVFERLGHKGKIAYVQGRAELSAHANRARSLRDTLTRYPDIRLAMELPHDPVTPLHISGAVVARRILEAHPDISAILCCQDNVALGVIDVLEQEALTGRIIVTGNDGIPQALAAIQRGTLFSTISQPAAEIARHALNNVVRLINGESAPKRTLLPVKLITRANVAEAALEGINYLPGMIEAQQGLIGSLRTSEERFRGLVELSSDWYWEQDENLRFKSIEGKSARFLGDSLGKTLWQLPGVRASEEQWTKHRAQVYRYLPFYDFEFEHTDAEGAVRCVAISGSPVFDKDGAFAGYRGIGKDITERRRAEERIEFLAYYDALTSLPNRSFFSRQMNRALAKAKRHQRCLAVLFVDLDRFKNINDALGHEAGDKLLVEVANRLRGCLREEDIVSRLGGDEFVVLLDDIDDPKHAATVARKILLHISRPITIEGYEYQMTASIGISVYPEHGVTLDTLMKHADVAMYMAKEEGKNNYQYYVEKANVHSFERLAFESGMRRALQRNEFVVYYQAKIDIRSGEVTGVEALLRWQHPERGLVSPAQFIPIAEETGLIVPIGKSVIRTACEQILEWDRQGLPKLPIAINLSPRQFFDESLVADVSQIVDETGVDPRLLEFEITESMVMRQTERAMMLLTQLKAMGIRLAIDDFGTGYSSFAFLRKFPIDTLKIDRSFIKDIPEDPEDGALTTAMIAMGKALNLRVVAEGVEQKSQLVFLKEHACDEVQGFYFSVPVPPERLAELLNRRAIDELIAEQSPPSQYPAKAVT
jgi:diguanylate cyclase (GGDEF)-like protein/PAS domain S-box-containing protein